MHGISVAALSRHATFGDAVMASLWRIALALLLCAFAIRAVQFGNPVIHIDEQFYLLVGDRIWLGDWPFVDSWDRKPIGLFLLYAAIRRLGGDGILAYQVVAALFAGATAFVIQRIAATVASARAALTAGILYLLLLMANGGDGGQAPVFYNLLVALTAWIVVRLFDVPNQRAALGRACVAMGLVGVSLQIKYTVVFEGIYFGLVLIGLLYRGGARRIIRITLLLIAVALLPTFVALLAYTIAGHGDAFIFANFVSIFARPRSMSDDAIPRLLHILFATSPVVLLTIMSVVFRRAWPAGRYRSLLLGWSGAAVVGLLIFGTYHDHYALALLVPLSVCSAPVLNVERWGRALGFVTIAASLAIGTMVLARNPARRDMGSAVENIAARVRPHAGDGLFVFSGQPVLYYWTGARPPTPFHFPTLLSEARDAATMGVDPLVELDRVMQGQPRFVVSRDGGFAEVLPTAWQRMAMFLRSDYCLVGIHRLRHRTMMLYEHRLYRNGAASCWRVA